MTSWRGWLSYGAGSSIEQRGWRTPSDTSFNWPRSSRPDEWCASVEEVFNDVPLDDALSSLGATVQVMAREDESAGLFNPADADLGVTGVDYAIARRCETGTAVVLPRGGVSRLTSLLPPVHVALVKPSQTLESLDDLYLLRRLDVPSRRRRRGQLHELHHGPQPDGGHRADAGYRRPRAKGNTHGYFGLGIVVEVDSAMLERYGLHQTISGDDNGNVRGYLGDSGFRHSPE